MSVDIYIHFFCVFFFKQKTAYEMRISDWSSDVCSSDLEQAGCGEATRSGTAWRQTSRVQLWRVERVWPLRSRSTKFQTLPDSPFRASSLRSPPVSIPFLLHCLLLHLPPFSAAPTSLLLFLIPFSFSFFFFFFFFF